MATDYYALLGVAKNASEEELRRAYRKLARELHPDANGGDLEAEARFKEVTVAYETLRDPERRRRYDMFGVEGGPRSAPTMGDVFGAGIGDLFESFFGGPLGGQRQAGPRRGEDVEVVAELAFEEAVFGVHRDVTFRGLSLCTSCAGSGAAPGSRPITCLECAGLGQVRRVRQSILGQVVQTAPCARCRGLGEVVETPCVTCRGEGRITGDRSVNVEIPAGVDEGTTLRLTGSGAPAPRGGIPGDLYVHLRVRADERFERDGVDLMTTVHLSVAQAALGASVDIETLDGSESLSVPAGSQSGREVRLRGRGVPHLRAHGRGDLHVRFVVDTPTELSKEEEQLLRDFARLRGEEVAPHESGLLFADPLKPVVTDGARSGAEDEDVSTLLRQAQAMVYVEDLITPSLSEDDERHLSGSLRLRPGERVVASDGRGGFVLCAFSTTPGERHGRERATLLPLGPVRFDAPRQRSVEVAFAMVKGDRSEWAAQKLTEVGVDRIVPLISKRSVVRLDEVDGRRRSERLRRVAREAAAQARRVRLPDVADVVDFASYVATLSGRTAIAAIAEPGCGALEDDVDTILVGPEGGWDDSELSAIDRRVGLGPNVLRSETAALVAALHLLR